MQRFFLAGDYAVGQRLSLPTELYRHLHTVLRVSVGDQVEFFNGTGRLATAEILPEASAQILATKDIPQPDCTISLIQGLPKGDKLDLVLQKGTELGINQFLIAPMERTVGRIKAERQAKRSERWQKIIQEAARQSKQAHLPRLQVCETLTATISQVEAQLKLILWEDADEPLAAVLPTDRPQSIAVIVGPEGGISSAEADRATAEGYMPVRLGPRILRTETAGLAITAILQYLYGDLA